MVFAALPEYGLLLFIKRRQKILILKDEHITSGSKDIGKPTNATTHKTNGAGNVKEKNVVNSQICNAWGTDRKSGEQDLVIGLDANDLVLKRMDSIAFVVFPIAFLLFIAVYCFSFVG